MNRLRCIKPNLKINKYSLLSNVSLVSIKRTLTICIPIKVVMIQCQFMLWKMIIPKRNYRLPTLMTLKLYRNEIIFPPSREDKLGRISSPRNPGINYFQKGILRFAKISKTAKICDQEENNLYRSRMSLWNRFCYKKTAIGALYGETVLQM